MDLDRRVALVVGVNGRMRPTLSRALARAGYAVVAADSSDSHSMVEGIDEPPDEAIVLDVDPTDPESTESMAASVVDRFGRIDVLINGSGTSATAVRGPWTEIELDEWDACFGSTVRSVWCCCRAVAPYMKAQRAGRIVNLGSTAPWTGTPGFLHYATATSALIGLTRSLARELGGYGIGVNMVCADLNPEMEPSRRPDDSDLAIDIVPSALDAPYDSSDAVGPILFLIDAGSDFITGQSYLVNGGSWVQ